MHAFIVSLQPPIHNVISPGLLYYRNYSPENATPPPIAEANPHFIGYHRPTTHQIYAGYWQGLGQDTTVVSTAISVSPAHFSVIHPHYFPHNVLAPGVLYYRARAADAFISPPAQAETNVNFIAKHNPTQYRRFTTGSRDFNEGQNVPIPGPSNRTTGTPPVVPTSAVPSSPLVPTMMGNTQEHIRQIAQTVNRNTQRSTNVTLDVTLRANQTTTTITDARIGYFSAISPAMAMTASAATALASGSVYVDTILPKSAVVHHPSNAAVDQKIRFVIIGA